jgi:hypothetical protein
MPIINPTEQLLSVFRRAIQRSVSPMYIAPQAKGGRAMASFISINDRSKRQRCSCCGHRIRLLGDQRSLSLFLGVKSAQRRASLCMNCGRVLCSDCNQNGFRCACGCNAWVALPYLEGSTIEAVEHQFA